MNWRVIPNPNDGTSPFRARIVKGEGKNMLLVALFITMTEAQLVVDLVESGKK